MFEKYYTPEQLEELAERRRTVGEERTVPLVLPCVITRPLSWWVLSGIVDG